MGGSNDETASTIADFLIKTILRHGAPRIQVTDNGTEFKNSTMRRHRGIWNKPYLHHAIPPTSQWPRRADQPDTSAGYEEAGGPR